MSKKLQHYTFNTYKNKSVLTDSEVVAFLNNTFNEIAAAKGFDILAFKILEDHVHCLIKYDSKHRIDYVIRMLKGISSRKFFKKYRTNRLVFRKLWARSYFAREVTTKEDADKTIRYIKSQIDSTGFDKRYDKPLRKEPTVSLSG